MSPTDKIDNLIKQLITTASPELDQRIDALIAQSAQQPDRPLNRWSRIMKSNITKSAAAAIIIATLTIIYQLTGSIDGASVAWADVLEQVYNAKTVTYKHKVKFETKGLTQISTTMQMEPGLMRTESSDADFISLHDYTSGTSMFLNPQIQSAEIRHYMNSKMSASTRNSYEWLKTLHKRDVQFVGEEIIDGSTYNVYMGKYPFSKTTVWVDPKTNLPAKVLFETLQNTSIDFTIPEITLRETDFGAEMKIITGKDGKIDARGISVLGFNAKNYTNKNFGLQDELTITYYDFDWNTQLDKSLFSMTPPENYKIEERTIDVSKVLKGEDALAHALDFWVTASNNTFPYSFDNFCDSNLIKPMIIEAFNKDGDPKEEWQAACKEAGQIFRGLAFALEKKVEDTWGGYVGRGVTLGQADTLICWWYDNEIESYKAIFGDLSIQEVSEDQLPIQQ